MGLGKVFWGAGHVLCLLKKLIFIEVKLIYSVVSLCVWQSKPIVHTIYIQNRSFFSDFFPLTSFYKILSVVPVL